jgi:hypothetical protein
MECFMKKALIILAVSLTAQAVFALPSMAGGAGGKAAYSNKQE